MTLAWETKTTECGRDTYWYMLRILLQGPIATVNPAYLFQEDFNTLLTANCWRETLWGLAFGLPSPGKFSPGVDDFWWKGGIMGFQKQWAFMSMYSLLTDPLGWHSHVCGFPSSVSVCLLFLPEDRSTIALTFWSPYANISISDSVISCKIGCGLKMF